MRLLFDQTQNNINTTVEIVDEKIVTLKEEVKDLSDFTNIVNITLSELRDEINSTKDDVTNLEV